MNWRAWGLAVAVLAFGCKSAEKKCAEDKDVASCQKACDADKTKSCVALADMKMLGKGTKKDGKGAYDLFKKACKADDQYACARSAYMMGRAGGPKYDNDKYIEIAKSACKAKEQLGCALWANATHYGTDDEKEKANDLVDKACDAGVPEGCVLKAQWAIDRKEKASKNLKVLQEACDSGTQLGCFYAALTLMYGSGGVDKDEEAALKLNKKGCDDDEALMCSLLGTQYKQGYGVPKSPKKAYTALKKACDLMDDSGHAYCKEAKEVKGSGGDDDE